MHQTVFDPTQQYKFWTRKIWGAMQIFQPNTYGTSRVEYLMHKTIRSKSFEPNERLSNIESYSTYLPLLFSISFQKVPGKKPIWSVWNLKLFVDVAGINLYRAWDF